MPEPLFREQLDQMCCTSPCCNAGSPGPQPLYIHGGCHVRATNTVALVEDILTVSCSECNKRIVEAHVVMNDFWAFAPQGHLFCENHPHAGIWTIYLEGAMHVSCAACKEMTIVLEVKPCPVNKNSN